MPFHATFTCLWCGSTWTTRSPDDLEGWAQLCPDCLGRAGENPFLRFRLRDALAERAAGPQPIPAAEPAGRAVGGAPPTTGPTSVVEAEPNASDASAADARMLAYYEARAPEYDDWYLRRGRYARGPIDDVVWAAELDEATRWLDRQPLTGRIVELAAGTGWWSPLLAAKGELWCYDGAPAPLDLARRRLVAHGLRAHLHVRDAWADPEFAADGLFAGFWLSHVPRPRLAAFVEICRRWVRPGGTFAFIDSRYDPSSSARDHEPKPDGDVAIRRLDDGRTFTIPKVYYEPPELEAVLAAAGFEDPTVTTTNRFFLLGRATG